MNQEFKIYAGKARNGFTFMEKGGKLYHIAKKRGCGMQDVFFTCSRKRRAALRCAGMNARLARVGGCIALCACTLLFPRSSAAAEGTVYEAERAALFGSNTITEDAEASGGQAAGRFSEEGDSLAFTVEVPEDGYYDLAFSGKGIGGGKRNFVYADGVEIGEIYSPEGVYGTDVVEKTPLAAGPHEIRVSEAWGWFYLDTLTVTQTEPVSDSVYEVGGELSNPNATGETKALYRFLQDCYGRYTLSGQFAEDGLDSAEIRAVYDTTGKRPAILGLDMVRYTPSRMAFGADEGDAVERAIAYHEAGGIVSFCWHWNAPANTVHPPGEGESEVPWWHGYREGNSFFDLSRVMKGDDPDGKMSLLRDIHAIAAQLKRLEAAGVPVLWRPLHEASGGWFWWGASGSEVFKEFWGYLYHMLTDVYKCNNLIWVCNCQDPAWYPGDAYVDILGDDIYAPPGQYAPQIDRFAELTAYPGKTKIAALTENGVVPDMEQCIAANVRWAWFCTWREGYVVQDGAYSSVYTEADMLRRVYDNDAVLTLEDLPRLMAAR